MLLLGCSGLETPDQNSPADWSWPSQDPRVRLETVLTARPGRHSTKGILRGLTGASAQETFVRPFGIAWDGDDLLVADPGSAKVYRLGPKGQLKAASREMFSGPIAVAACSFGVLVSDSQEGTLTLLDRRLRPVAILGAELERPTGIACSGSHVFVSETGRHRLLELSVETNEDGTIRRAETTRTIGKRGDKLGEFNFPTALAVDKASLWVADTLNFRLQQLDLKSGDFVNLFGQLGDSPGEMPRVKGLAVDASRQLWLSDAHLEQVAVYRADGTFLFSIGSTGTGPAQFSFPAGVAAHPDGRVAVVDSLNRRVQVFRHLPRSARDEYAE
jgi:DNA-binding beta-propeller fold protein YncE